MERDRERKREVERRRRERERERKREKTVCFLLIFITKYKQTVICRMRFELQRQSEPKK